MIEQRVVIGRPPVFDEARALFGPLVDHAIFSWGEVIYNPSGEPIPAALMVHEAVHGERQLKSDIKAWWRLYLDSPDFRLNEEISAHAAEYRWFAARGNRTARRHALKHVAGRLAGPLYGNMISLKIAKSCLRMGA